MGITRDRRKDRRRFLMMLNGGGYADDVLATSPIAYWKLGEGSGATITDSSGNGYNGSYTGVTVGATTAPQGTPAPLWDGVGDFGNVYSAGIASAFNMNEFTVLIWLKTNSAAVWTDSANRFIFRFLRNASNLVDFYKLNTANTIRMSRTGEATAKTADFTVSSPAGWVNFIVSCSIAGGGLLSAGQMRTYQDGAAVATTTGNINAINSGLDATQTTLGAANTSATFSWHGYLAHAIVWDRPIDAAILALATV